MGTRAPTYFKLCKIVGQNLARLPRGLATVFSVTFFRKNLVTVVGELVITPLQQKVSRHVT